ncbi:hypothetical protein BDR07DRAFT_473620 [Suillus spraguei]|nr:hypothetical protein BDR07DRAFT_473620 [Suillus spraguei]
MICWPQENRSRELPCSIHETSRLLPASPHKIYLFKTGTQVSLQQLERARARLCSLEFVVASALVMLDARDPLNEGDVTMGGTVPIEVGMKVGIPDESTLCKADDSENMVAAYALAMNESTRADAVNFVVNQYSLARQNMVTVTFISIDQISFCSPYRFCSVVELYRQKGPACYDIWAREVS